MGGAGSLEGRRVLITGASGYIGSALGRALASRTLTILRLTRDTSRLATLEGRASVVDVAGDIRDLALWENVLDDVDIVIHLAAQTSVPVAEQDPRLDWEANILPMLNLLETCRRKRLRPTVFIAGTTTECGLPKRLPVDESHPDEPITIYDLHKLTAERYLAHYVAANIVDGACLRLSNVYGPGPSSKSRDRGVLNAMVRRAVAGEAVTIYGEGDHLRDYVYIDDVVRAFLAASERISKVNGQHFIVGSGQAITIGNAFRMVARRVEELTGRKVRVDHVRPPGVQHPIDNRDFVADVTRFSRAAEWSPMVTLQDGIDRTIESVLGSRR